MHSISRARRAANLGEGGRVHSIVVILRADFDSASGHVADGVVSSVVAKGELKGRATEGLTQDLVAHADSKHRQLADNGLGILDGVGDSRWVTLQCNSVSRLHSQACHAKQREVNSGEWGRS